MRYFLAFFLLVHAVAHLVGFLVPWQLWQSAEMPYRTTIFGGRFDLGPKGILVYGAVWLLLAVGFAVVSLGVLWRANAWLAGLTLLVLVSLLFCLLGWPDTKVGLFANLLAIALASLLLRGSGDELALQNPALETLWQQNAGLSGSGLPSNGLPSPALPQASSLPPESASAKSISAAPEPVPPEAAQRLLQFLGVSNAAQTPANPSGPHPHRAVRLRMEGEIKLGRWFPFQAEQVITHDGQFVWAATVSVFGLPIVGSDQLLRSGSNRDNDPAEGSMAWMLFDLLPVAVASGPDVTRSAWGRLHGERAVWLPSSLRTEPVTWLPAPSGQALAELRNGPATSQLRLPIDQAGKPAAMELNRWGNPNGPNFQLERFGAEFLEWSQVQGYRIPAKIRAGWFFGTPRYQAEGEFFRATITKATFR